MAYQGGIQKEARIEEDDVFTPDVLVRLHRDVLDAARSIPHAESRFHVDLYYQLQRTRMRIEDQMRKREVGEPSHVLAAFMTGVRQAEKAIVRVMDVYTDDTVEGRWAKAQYGVGPIITAGFLAELDFDKAETAGQVWRFCGLDPTTVWKKGERRPWNARLKRLAWNMGSCFWRFHNRPACLYGRVIAEKKAWLVNKNQLGGFAELARTTLASRTFSDGKTREAYEAGRLPDGRIHLMAQRVGVKLFLAHLHQVGRERRGYTIREPYVMTMEGQGRHQIIRPAGWDSERRELEADVVAGRRKAG